MPKKSTRKKKTLRSTRPHYQNKRKKRRNYSRPEYFTPAYQNAIKQVKERDGNRCQMPNCNRYRYGIECHHIIRWHDAPGLRYNPQNLICLCKKCHQEITGKEAIYAPLFFSIVQSNTQKQTSKKIHYERLTES